MRFLRYVPKNHLSRVVGRIMHMPLPRPLARWTVRKFAAAYRIDVDEAQHPIAHYGSIGQFFTRDLREGLRPIESDLVSPVDGVLRNYGVVENGRLPQIKGKSYALSTFIGDEALASRYLGGAYFNLYLSPQDYHHVHFPVGGRIVKSVHIPGKLWPVNDWSMSTIDELFSINERVITFVESPYGLVAVVMIGATNVGKISVTYDSFVSNASGTSRTVVRPYDPPLPVDAGSRLGTFHMGSSVVMLFEPGRVALDRVRLEAGTKVRYGAAVLEN